MKRTRSLVLLALVMSLIMATPLIAGIAIQYPPHDRQFDPKFKDKYSGRKFNYEGREITGATYPKFENSSKYSDQKPELKDDDTSDDFSIDFNIFNGLFIFILVIAVGYLAYILLKDGSSTLFSSKADKKLVSSDEITAENIRHADINTLITNAENDHNYRLAIRYLYVLVLKQLTVHNFITYKDDKTNTDYLNAIASEKFSDKFAYTSYIYSYTWYGEFALSLKQYQLAKEKFVQLIKEIRS